jgi:hypothetical protein
VVGVVCLADAVDVVDVVDAGDAVDVVDVVDAGDAVGDGRATPGATTKRNNAPINIRKAIPFVTMGVRTTPAP